MELPALSPTDKARLMLNLPTLANRFVRFNGVSYPILHLGIGDLEQFRAICTPIETLYLEFVKSDLSLIAFMKIYNEKVSEIFKVAVPKAASIVLGLPEGTIKASCRPLEGFSAVLAQWLHNQEIGALQVIYPPPLDDEPEKHLLGDPSIGNPMGIIQKMASAYHWSFEDILKQTVPQVYLMGNDSAWSHATMMADSKKGQNQTSRKPIIVDGKKREDFNDMDGNQYRNYLDKVFNMGIQTKSGIVPMNVAGGA